MKTADKQKPANEIWTIPTQDIFLDPDIINQFIDEEIDWLTYEARCKCRTCNKSSPAY